MTEDTITIISNPVLIRSKLFGLANERIYLNQISVLASSEPPAGKIHNSNFFIRPPKRALQMTSARLNETWPATISLELLLAAPSLRGQELSNRSVV